MKEFWRRGGRSDERDRREDDEGSGVAEVDPVRIRVLHEASQGRDREEKEQLESPLGRESSRTRWRGQGEAADDDGGWAERADGVPNGMKDGLVVRRHDDARQEQHDDSEDRLLDSPGKRDRESERRNERKGGEHRPGRREPEGGSFQPAPREDEDASPNVPQRSSYAVRQQEDPDGRDDPGAKCEQRSDEPRGSHPERTPTIPPFAPHNESADCATRDHEMQHFHGGQAGTNEAQEEQHEDPRTERLEDENAGGPSELPVVRGPVLLSVHEEHDRGGDVVHPDGLHEEAEPAPQTRDEQPATAVGIQVTEERLGSERREEEIVPGREASEVVRHAPGNAQQDHEPSDGWRNEPRGDEIEGGDVEQREEEQDGSYGGELDTERLEAQRVEEAQPAGVELVEIPVW